MCVTVCGKFVPDEGVVAGYDNRIRDKKSRKMGRADCRNDFGARSSVKSKAVRACTIRCLNLGHAKYEKVAIYAVNHRISNI